MPSNTTEPGRELPISGMGNDGRSAGKWYTPVVAFFYLWLVLGFFTGTVLLVGPVQWITKGARAVGLGGQENLIMLGVILGFVIGSFLFTRWVLKRSFRHTRRMVRVGVPAIATIAAAASLYAWLNPTMLAAAAGGFGSRSSASPTVAMAEGAEFHFGGYPDEGKLEELKREGYTAVISLQHPAVVPFEPEGIAREKEATSKLGIRFIHAPMVPWVASNESSLEKIRQVALAGHGKYYVHCGLGRDRTNVVKHMLEQLQGAKVEDAGAQLAATTFRDRKEPLERGAVVEVAPDVWLIPYPNKHEIYGNMLAGQVNAVVSLLDPADSTQASWNASLTQTLREYSVPFSVRPVPASAGEAAFAAAATYALSLPRPAVVIVPFTRPESADTRVADAFARAVDAQGRGER